VRPASGALRVSQTIRAGAEELFRAWTDPEDLSHWWRQEGDGWAFSGASIDLRIGGRYRLGMTGPDGRTHVASGVYREIRRPECLVFTWDWEDPATRLGGETLVTVEFRSIGNERTEVVVTHERFPDPARMGRHEQGWIELMRLLERHFGEGSRAANPKGGMS
jgi:uncharacterized protein YndB with AHSA1/START domain